MLNLPPAQPQPPPPQLYFPAPAPAPSLPSPLPGPLVCKFGSPLPYTRTAASAGMPRVQNGRATPSQHGSPGWPGFCSRTSLSDYASSRA